MDKLPTRLAVITLTLAACLACGKDDPTPIPVVSLSSGEATVKGNVGGSSFTVGGVVANTNATFLSNSPNVGFFGFSSFSLACSSADARAHHKNSRTMSFLLSDTIGNGFGRPPKAPGTYTVRTFAALDPAPLQAAIGSYSVYDDGCQQTSVDFISGTVTLTRISGGYAGTFDVMSAANEHITGAFDSVDCPRLDFTAGDGGSVCQ